MAYGTCCPFVTSAGIPAARSPRPDLDLYLGLHRVVDSDGAVSGMARVSHRGFAVEVSDTTYFERRPTLMDSSDRIRLDAWALTVQARPLIVASTEAWLVGGVGASTSTEFEPLIGPLLGARVRHQLFPQLAFEASGRYLFLDRGVSAMEGAVGVQASVLRVGYRRLEFDVGPPLHGPEVGLAFRF